MEGPQRTPAAAGARARRRRSTELRRFKSQSPRPPWREPPSALVLLPLPPAHPPPSCGPRPPAYPPPSSGARGGRNLPREPATGGTPLDAANRRLCRVAARGEVRTGSMWFCETTDPGYVKANYLESVYRLRELLNSVDGRLPLLAAGGERPSNSQHGVPVGPSGKGPIADSIMGLAKKHEFEYRAPAGSLDSATARTLDHWNLKQVRSAAGDPARSAAGDPDLEHLFHPQLTDEDGNRSMVRAAGGDSIEVRRVFAVTLACVFAEYSTAASAADIWEMYKAWPIVHAKKQRQRRGAGSAEASRWQRQWWGTSSGWKEKWGGSNEGWAPAGGAADEFDDHWCRSRSRSAALQRRASPSSSGSS